MPTTPQYGLTYPALTDPPNGAAQMQDLAEGTESVLAPIDTRVGDTETRLTTAETLLAAINAGRAVLPDNEPLSGIDAWENWSEVTVSLPNPGVAVHVQALGSGHAYYSNTTTNHYASIRMGISLDGAATFSYGNGPRTECGYATDWAAISALHLVSGTPTGNIVVKTQIQTNASGDIRFFNGQMSCLTLPVG